MLRDRHSYPRRQYRHAFWTFLKRNAVMVTAVGAMFLLVAVIETRLAHGYALGLIHGAMIMTFIFMVIATFVGTTGSMNQIVGSWGEDNTREQLRAAQRRRLIWGWVDNVEIQGGDVDHLVLLRDGRFIAIDSKWHSVDLTDEVLARDAASGAAAARRASLVLRSLKAVPDVVPLVVLWGGTHDRLRGAPAEVAGVSIISGHDLRRWLGGGSGAVSDREKALEGLRALQAFKDRVRPGASVTGGKTRSPQ